MRVHAEIKELLAIYDRLPPDESAEVNAHVAICAECASELAAWRRMDRALRYMPDPAPSPALREKLPLSQPRSLAQENPEPRRMPQPSPPPPPVAPRPEPAPRAPFPWPRLLLPVGLVLLFAASIWLGMRDTSRGPMRVATPERPALAGTPKPGATEVAGSGATIIFACEDVAAVYKDYAAVARAFEKENPDIKVVLKSYRDLIGNQSLSYVQYMQEVAANADAFCVWDVAPLVEADLLYNLDAFVARDTAFDANDFYPAVLNRGRQGRSLYSVPSRFQPALIRYDPAAFDDAGLTRPRPGWTWEEFAGAAETLTRRRGGNTQRWGFAEDNPLLFNARFSAATQDPQFLAAAGSDDPFKSEAVVDLFRWYGRLYVTSRAAAVPRNFENEAGFSPLPLDSARIGQGRVAMWTDLLYENARRQGNPAPFPTQTETDGAPFIVGPAWSVAAETLQPTASWRFLSYLSRNPPPDRGQLRLPARRSLAMQSPLWQDTRADEAEVYRYVLDHLAPASSNETFEATQGLRAQLQSMVAGRVSLNELLTRHTPVEQAAPERLDRPAIRFAAPRDDLLAYQELAQRFEQEKGIRVDLVAREDLIDSARSENSMLWTQMRQIANRADALAGPEVAALVRSGRSDGILHDLTSLASTLPAEDFFPNTLESLQWRGSARAVPARVSAHLILYNQWMFDQMGVPYPEVGWTWNDFDRVVEAVTSRGADKLKWAGFRDGPGGLPVLLMSRLPALVDYTGDSARPGWGGSEAVDALRWYGGLAQRGALLPPGAGETEAPATSAPADAAMWVAPVELSALAGLRQGQIGAVPFPVNERGDPTNPIEVLDAYAISASSERVAAAWEWIQYLLKRDAGTSALRAGVSAQRALVALAAGDGESGRIYRYALEHARRLDALRPEEYMMQQALRQAVIDVVARRTEPELAVQKALGALHRPGDP